MQISTKGRYALRMMVDLATLEPGVNRSIREISERQHLSEKYLEQLVRPLVKVGYVSSIRGVLGGYFLTKPADEITVGDVLRTVEGDLAPVRCVSEMDGGGCDRMVDCATVEVWRRILEAIEGVVDSITLTDLVSENGAMDAVCPEND